ncbi:MAG: GatB/YqeY domain-containing protein, partial [Chloroflexota bacterium]|nr:GatB/YqeY domain-containing protein [Chloroflexota bacterium]
LAEREAAQLEVLERYLPAELSDAELAVIVNEVIVELGASNMKEMGRVMPVVIERVAGRADGRRISDAVRAALSST